MRVYMDSSSLIASVKKVAEPEHAYATAIVRSCPSQNEMITSSLSVTEFTVALAKHTRLDLSSLERAIDLLVSRYELKIVSHDEFIEAGKALAFEHRELARKLDMPSGDIHHVAAAYMLNAPILVTTDRHHLLKDETVKSFAKYTRILPPAEATKTLRIRLTGGRTLET